MTSELRNVLGVLVGLPLWSSGRAGDMQWFQLGARITRAGYSGRTKELGEYALHVQCAWRILRHARVAVARDDLYCREGGDRQDPRFDWDAAQTRRDARMSELLSSTAGKLVVRGVVADGVDAVKLVFDDGYVLEICPVDSLDSERWRLISNRGERTRHWVATRRGLDDG